MSHLTQMAGLTVQNFVSAAVGIAVAVALIRGLTRRRRATIGNFWVDLTRATTRVLAPALRRRRARCSRARASCRACAGRPRRRPSRARRRRSTAAPVASQEAIKELGTNGGGSSTRTRRIRSRTRRRSRTCSRCWALLADPVRARPTRSAGWSATGARAGRSSPRCSCSGSARPALATGFEVDGNPRVDAARARTWRARRCASAPPPPASSPPPRPARRPAR